MHKHSTVNCFIPPHILKNIAINSNIAFNWISPKLAGQKDKTSFNSVMANGDWYKIEIKDNSQGTSSGIYKISKKSSESMVFLVPIKALYPLIPGSSFSTLKHYIKLQSLKFTGGFLC